MVFFDGDMKGFPMVARVSLYIISLFFVAVSFAQTGAEVTIPSAADAVPLTFEYIAGGDFKMREIYGELSGCTTSWVAAANEPDHILTLVETMPFFRVTVSSNADTIMIAYPVDGEGNPNGDIRCNDDTINTNPELSATPWEAGRYYIFIGTYRENFANYTITFSPESR